MEIKGYFGKKELDRIIQHVNRCNIEKTLVFYEVSDDDMMDDFRIYECLYPFSPFTETEDLSKSEMLYLQKHGFVFVNEHGEIVNVKTLKE